MRLNIAVITHGAQGHLDSRSVEHSPPKLHMRTIYSKSKSVGGECYHIIPIKAHKVA